MTVSTGSRRRRLLVTAALFGAGCGLVPTGAGVAAPGQPTPTGSNGPPAHVVTVVPEVSSSPSISADGRLVVYAGPPAVDDGRASTVWLLDRRTGTTTEITTPMADVRLGSSVHPTISADGCRVAVVTEMPYDLFRDDDLGSRWDVYSRLLPACHGQPDDWDLLSTVADDTYGVRAGDDADPNVAPALSGSGSVAAFVRLPDAPRNDALTAALVAAQHPAIDAPSEPTGVAVVDLTVAVGDAGRITPVAGTPSTAPDSTFRVHGIRQPSLSDDGRFVAFTSDAASAAADPVWGIGPTPGGYATSQVFVWDRQASDPAGAVQPVSSPAAAPADGEGSAPAMSGNGRYVAFQSTSTNLVPAATLPPCPASDVPGGCRPQVYRLDRDNGSVVLVSRTDGEPATSTPAPAPATPPTRTVAAADGAHDPAIGFDGRDVTFLTRSANLFAVNAPVTDGVNGDTVVLARPDDATVERVSLLPGGTGVAPAAQTDAHLSVAAGRSVVFTTSATAAYLPATVEDRGVDPGVAASGTRVVIVDRNPQLSMADLAIGTVAVGYPSPEWFVKVINNGPAVFVPGTITTSDPSFGITGGSCAPGVAVQPGSSCQVNIIFTPPVAGPSQSTLTVAEDGAGALAVSSTLSGSGGEPALAISPSVAGFADTVVGATSDAATFQVSNVGYAPANVIGAAVDGTDAKDFRIVRTDCARVLQIGETCTVEVAFAPTIGGLRSASVNVATDLAQSTGVLVNGTGTYTSQLVVSSDRLFTGGRFGIGGIGFAPSTPVILRWADGSGGTYLAVTNRDGAFLTSAVLARGERPGRRTLVAQTVAGQSAAADLVVVPGFSIGGGLPGAATWPAG